jgi:uncharacterized DUF497 family protein
MVVALTTVPVPRQRVESPGGTHSRMLKRRNAFECVSNEEQDDAIRIISARRATLAERKLYEEG